eukprot:334706-Prorocentrum_lima.AAC.1
MPASSSAGCELVQWCNCGEECTSAEKHASRFAWSCKQCTTSYNRQRTKTNPKLRLWWRKIS